MNEIKKKSINRSNRSNRVRAKIYGTSERPRLALRISNSNVYAQIIDDSKGVTLVSTSTINQKGLLKSSLTEKAEWAGSEIAKKAKSAKITKVVFDRGQRAYHGRVSAAANSARKEGLEF